MAIEYWQVPGKSYALENPDDPAVHQEIQNRREKLDKIFAGDERYAMDAPDGMHMLEGNSRLFVVDRSPVNVVEGTVFYRIDDKAHHFHDVFSAARKTFHQERDQDAEYARTTSNGRRRELESMRIWNLRDRDDLLFNAARAEERMGNALGKLRKIAQYPTPDQGYLLKNENPHYFPSEATLQKFIQSLDEEVTSLGRISLQPFHGYGRMLAARVQELKQAIAGPGKRNNVVVPELQRALHDMEAILSLCMLQASLEVNKVDRLKGSVRTHTYPGVSLTSTPRVYPEFAEPLFSNVSKVREKVEDLIALPGTIDPSDIPSLDIQREAMTYLSSSQGA